jgi:hypothetical protein
LGSSSSGEEGDCDGLDADVTEGVEARLLAGGLQFGARVEIGVRSDFGLASRCASIVTSDDEEDDEESESVSEVAAAVLPTTGLPAARSLGLGMEGTELAFCPLFAAQRSK